MCGIAAAIRPPGMCPACHAPGLGICSQVHRGPHSSGSIDIQLPWCTVSLGMSRLKIVDQRDLPVPYRFDRLGISLAFNGEIYNWKTLRSSPPLDQYGPWETECDAEVLAAAWREWGTQALQHLNGMWSFVLVDTILGEIAVARDRAGLKPLFWTKRGGALYFASEAKALPVPLEERPCIDIETFEYDVLEETPLRGVHRFGPAHRAVLRGLHVLEPGAPIGQTRWWELPPAEPSLHSADQLVDELEDLVLDAVRLRMVAEVPVALMVSGGLDSSLILAAADRLQIAEPKRYCVTFEEIDNLSAAKIAANGREVTPVTFDKIEMLRALPHVAYHLDTPATWTAICLWFMCQQIAKDGNRIVISGEGADELFGGYSRYRVLHWIDRMLKDERLADYLPTIVHAIGDPTELPVKLLDRGRSAKSRNRAAELFQQYRDLCRGLPMQLATVEFHTTMQVLLRMADRMASAWSLENRCPLLDYRIMEFSTTVPDGTLVNDSESKSILRTLARRWKISPVITEERTKRGLAIPWPAWSAERGESIGSRGQWDRSGFATLMRDHWKASLALHRSCISLTPR